MRVSDARAALRTHIDLIAEGTSQRAIARAIASGELHKLSRGLYVDGPQWADGKTESRELIRTVAAHRRMRGSRDVFVSTSAAALHGLPLARIAPQRAHVAGPHTNGRVHAQAPFVARHEITIAESDVVEVDGIRCTSMASTIADLLRTTRAEAGISAADAAMRRVAWNDDERSYDEGAGEAFRDEVAVHLPARSRGVVQARRLLALADGRADGPGESISRLCLLELGFTRLRLQVPVRGPQSHDYHVDFGLDEVDVWGEFDGKGKYTDPAMRRPGESIEDVVLREKSRENWIVGVTGRRLVRWEWEHIANADTLRRRLAAFGIHSPAR